jgi:hypothetical protein
MPALTAQLLTANSPSIDFSERLTRNHMHHRASLRAVGGATEWLRTWALCSPIWFVVVNLMKERAGEAARPDVAEFVASGLLEEALQGVRAFEAGGAVSAVQSPPILSGRHNP